MATSAATSAQPDPQALAPIDLDRPVRSVPTPVLDSPPEDEVCPTCGRSAEGPGRPKSMAEVIEERLGADGYGTENPFAELPVRREALSMLGPLIQDLAQDHPAPGRYRKLVTRWAFCGLLVALLFARALAPDYDGARWWLAKVAVITVGGALFGVYDAWQGNRRWRFFGPGIQRPKPISQD